MNTLLINKKGTILQVKLNRADKRNALNSAVIAALTNVFSESALDKELRLIHLSGVGKDFCVGADLNWMKSSVNLSADENYQDADRLYDMYQGMHDCPIPIVTYVHGHVFGGGVGLSAASDIVIADRKAVFSMCEVKRGLIPSVMLPFVNDKIPSSRLRELLITGREFSANAAMEYGLIHFKTDEKKKHDVLQNIFKDLMQSAPLAVQICRKLLKTTKANYTRNHVVQALADKRKSLEAQEGLNAFFSKRKPAWENPYH